MLVCAECGRANPADARFCSGCGTKLELEAAEPREERKIVSVLFADLVGFTARSEQLDPEDVRSLLSPYYARLRHELERHGGTVEKFIGDAVMALFGAPVAHEDDPERAVRAALAIRDWVREEKQLQLRVAVNTGEALVSLDARPAEGEGLAAGDVVNTTARLQSAAPVNGVLVGERTYRATRAAIDYRELDPVQAKGKEEPLQVWEALQAHAALGVDVPHEARTELVGRERELEVLRAALERARDERAPQLVTLVGVPGIGKSRLLYELSRIVEAEPELISWRQGRSLPYGEGVSFWALAEVVKAQAGILEGEGAEEAGAKLGELVRGLIPEATDAEWVRRNLAALVGAGDVEASQGADRRSEAFAAWRRFLEALAEERPLVLVLEDLHWADDALLDFVDHLVDWASGVQLLVVATARPELLERRPNWGGGKPNATTLSLSPLSDDDAARLLGSLLSRPLLEAGEQTRVLERVGGNPLYAEQYAQLLDEGSGEGELPLPESVQGIVGARLDALPADEKQLLQDAAVIGKVFWPSAVAALAGTGDRGAALGLEERLHALERKQFVRRERRSSVGGETQYAFLHLLLRDVAYAQIPRAARIEKHVAAARWLEGLGRPEDHAEMLAHHYLSALETARASGRDEGELAPPARAALADAGDRAASLSAYAAAARFYREALALWPEEASSERADLLYRLANATFDAGEPERDELLELAGGALLAEGDRARAGELEALRAQYWWLRAERERCYGHLERAHELVSDSPPSRGTVRVLSQAARFRALAGEDVEGDAREALRLAEELGLDDIRADVLITLGSLQGWRGRAEERAQVEEGLRIAVAGGLLPLQVRAYSSLAALAEDEGDLRGSMRLSEAAEQVARQIGGGAAGIRWSRGNLITSLFELGEWDRLEREADAFLEQSAVEGAHYHDAHVHVSRALLRLARDDDGALADQAAALERSRAAKDPQQLRPAVAVSSYILAELGRDDEARGLLDEALAWDELDYAVDFLFWTADLYDRSLELAGRLPEVDLPRTRALRAVAEGRYVDAADEFDSMGAVSSAARARLRAAERLQEERRAVEAEEQLAAALAFYRAVRATRYIRRGEALLARSA